MIIQKGLTLTKMIYYTLVNHLDARTDDKILMYHLINDFGGIDPELINTEMSCKLDEEFLFNLTAFPNLETISRTRRKLMEMFPELKPPVIYNKRNNKMYYENIPCFINHVFSSNSFTINDVYKVIEFQRMCIDKNNK